MATLLVPYRGDGSGRPVDLTRMPLVLHGRPRKRWRYVGVFGERLMLCAGVVQVGPVGQTFWAVWDRERRALHERTRLGRAGRRAVALPAGVVRVRDGDVRADLVVEPGQAVETVSPAGRAWMWTRKQGGVRVHGTVEIGGRTVEVDAPGCVDDSAGYHPRETAWAWSAGAGVLDDGRSVAWNLVEGIHDARARSERTVWLEGEPSEVPPVAFAGDLSGLAFTSGEELGFAAEATRRRTDDLGLFRSDYVQPFGAFTGTLPGDLRLAAGRGVMERHTARW